MPARVEWILYILLVIVMRGVLIAIHELGHLSTAKLFKVYCFEYSIGMGPKLFSKKRKNGETAFSLRAIPFGGFVSMYGEPGAVPEGYEEPAPERSLNNIAKWKKCIILVAGVTLNFLLGLTLIYIGDSACPMYYSGRLGATNAEGAALTVTLDTTYNDKVLSYIDAHKTKPEHKPQDYVLTLPSYEVARPDGQGNDSYQILSSRVMMFETDTGTTPLSEKAYVAVYAPSTVIARHGLGDSLMLFPASEKEVPSSLTDLGVDALPDIYDGQGKLNQYNFGNSPDGFSIGLKLNLMHRSLARSLDCYPHELVRTNELDPDFRLVVKGGKLTGDMVSVEIIKEWNSFPESWNRWSKDVPTACTAIVKGFASIFTPNGWKNLSGIIGITAAMPQVSAAGGARMVFFYAGLISINLAFFNLLPFPGLDGWSLLVTAIEGISHKKVPARVQGIVSTVGLVLLFGLMILIAVKDVVALI